MDADRFDTLARALTTAESRRRALALALSGTLGPLLARQDAAAHDLSAKCKKKKGKQKRKCLKKAKKHNATHVTQTPPSCTPNCGGKTCGPDGCGSVCGACTNGTCTDDTCLCQPGMEVCRGDCVSDCSSSFDRALNPLTCKCCLRSGSRCNPPGNNPACCTGTCLQLGGSLDDQCAGFSGGGDCQFDGQCSTGFCLDGTCGCPAGRELCAGGGGCSDECQSGQVHRPGTCRCCTINGTSCGAALPACCAAVSGGPDQCINGTCHGRADGDACTFPEQCADTRFGCVGGTCGGVNEQ